MVALQMRWNRMEMVVKKVVFDFETTGFWAECHEIVHFSANSENGNIS